ncbi:MAG: hypothetical protein MMC23_003814 [Stictis urceolatum]|nr:hypothetical protein [Stictis urceolata]
MNLPHRPLDDAQASSTQHDAVVLAKYIPPATSTTAAPPTSPPGTSPPRLIRSRRKRWLSLNPSYFTTASADVELSDPLSYDRLIRQHQSTAEREEEGKAKGWAKTLETSLVRGEARLADIDPSRGMYGSNGINGTHGTNGAHAGLRKGPGRDTDWSIAVEPLPENEGQNTAERNDHDTTHDGSVDEEAAEDEADTRARDEAKTHGEERWHELIAERFVAGEDEDFDYSKVDEDEELDADEGLTGAWTEREKQAKWFEEEESDTSKSPGKLEGETGVQDY